MNKVGFGIVVLALLAISPEVALGQKGKQFPQKEKQIPQQFMGMWCTSLTKPAKTALRSSRVSIAARRTSCRQKGVCISCGMPNMATRKRD
jgi:hypothetical protein